MIGRLGTYRKTGIVSAETGESGSQIGFIAGAVAAVALAYFTGGTSIYAYLAFASIGGAVGGLLGSIIDPVKPKEPHNLPVSGIKDFYVTSAALGQMVPILYGTYRVPGNVIQASQKFERQVGTVIGGEDSGQIIDPILGGITGGAAVGVGSKLKGGGAEAQIVFSKVYSITMGIALCEGPIKAIKRIWTDLDLFYDETSDLGHLRYDHEDDNTIYFNGVNNSVKDFLVYKGTESQVADGYLTGILGNKEDLIDPDSGEVDLERSQVSGYRGTAYVVLSELDLGSSGRVPNFTFEVVKDRTAVERPVDLTLGADGLYVLYTKDMVPQKNQVHYVGIWVKFGEDPDVDNPILYLQGLSGPDGPETWADLGITYGTLIIEGALILTNNRTCQVTHIDGKTLIADNAFMQDHNQIDITQPRPPIHTKDRQGLLRSYQTPLLQEANVQDVGIFAEVVLSANQNGSSNDMVFATSQGTQDAADDTTDAGSVFLSGLSITNPNGGTVPLRSGGEAAAGTRIGVGKMASNGDRYFYVCLEESQELLVFDALNNAWARASVGSKPMGCVWSPLGGGVGYIYVLKEDNDVARYSGGFELTFIDNISIGSGARFAQLLRARADNRIWLGRHDGNTLAHFTTAGDVGSVNVMSNPYAITDARDDFVWVASLDRGEMCRVNPTTYAVQTFEVPDIMTSIAPAQDGKIWAVSSHTRSAIYLIATDGSYAMLNLPYGASKVVADISDNPRTDGYAYVMCESSNTVVSVAPDCARFHTIDSGAGLARCIEDLSVRAGMSPDRLDTSGLINNQVNFILSEVASAKDTINLLCEAYQFNFVESEGYLRFYHNYSVPTVAEIQENTLAGGIDKEDTKSLGVSRLQERELPVRVSVTYTSPERNYNDRAEVVQLTSGNIEQNPQVYRYPLAMTPQEAFQLAEIKLYEPWAQRERMEFTLPPLFILLDPGDAVQVIARDISYNIRINEMTRARTWLNTVRGLSTYPPTFPEVTPTGMVARATPRAASSAVPRQFGLYQDTIPTPGVTQPVMDPANPGTAVSVPGLGIITLQNPSRMAIILIEPPALSPTDIVLRSYLGTYRTQHGRAFTQATLYRSAGGIIDFTYAGTDATESTAGRALTALPSVINPYVWDDINTVDIEMLAGTLRMVSDLDALSGANRAMLGGELLQFVRPTLIAPNIYRLSRLLRGRLGTQEFIGTHAIGDTFVLLDGNTVRDTYIYERAIVDREYFYRTIDATTSLGSAESFSVTLHGNSLKPWAPVLKPVLRAGSDIQLSWLYRARLNPDLVDYGGIAWDVDFTKQFQIVIYTSGFTAVQNVYTTPVFPGSAENTLVFTYTTAQQVADFGTVQAQVYYGIAGLGAQNVLGYESRSYG